MHRRGRVVGRRRPLLTPICFRAISPAAPVLGADGRVHPAYELQVANQSGLNVTLDRLQTLRGNGTGAPLATLSGRSLPRSCG